ncbi:hypothetical protein [Streptomyces racemochromogenes]|uniref:hypothetical protein n=1 Tax=Streptomyces racemochromogenes TaxID=67353 RepID=UPI0031ED9051
MTPEQMSAAEELTGKALVPYSDRRDAHEVACLTDDLVTCGKPMYEELAAAEQTPQVRHARADWSYFTEVGPMGTGDHANWTYARTLARIVQLMVRTLREHEPAPW